MTSAGLDFADELDDVISLVLAVEVVGDTRLDFDAPWLATPAAGRLLRCHFFIQNLSHR